MTEVPTRLLRNALRDRAASGSSACLDAERLAAWADDEVSAREREAIESHAADCARCQALLAAMAKTTPPAPERAWWRVPAFGWVASLTAAAAALLVSVGVFNTARRAPESSDVRPETIASAKPSPEPAAVPQSRAATPQAFDAAPVVPPPAPAPAPLSDQRVAANEQARDRAQPPASVERREAVAPRRSAPSSSNAVAVATPPAPAPPPPATAPPPAAAADASVARPVPAPAPPPPASPAEPAAPAAPARNAQTSAGAAPANATQFYAREAAPPMLAKSLAAPAIISPDGGARWRIVAGGGVERSADSGVTWQAQSTGVSTALTAGAATSSTTCWLVGPGGIVLLSTDGRTWQRAAFPEAVDLTSVRPIDDKRATVVAAGGRTFTTADGGRTWSR